MVRTNKLLGLAAALLLGGIATSESAHADSKSKAGCPDGFTVANKGFCYRVDRVNLSDSATRVIGILVSTAKTKYEDVDFGLSLFDGKKLVVTCQAAVHDVGKGDQIPFEAIGDPGGPQSPTTTTLHITQTYP